MPSPFGHASPNKRFMQVSEAAMVEREGLLPWIHEWLVWNPRIRQSLTYLPEGLDLLMLMFFLSVIFSKEMSQEERLALTKIAVNGFTALTVQMQVASTLV